MSKVTLTLPSVGELDSAAEPRVTTALKALEEFLNGAKIESTDNIKAEGITEASLSSALKTKLGGSFVGLTVEEKTVNFEAESAKLYKANKALTMTLPAATSGRTIGVFNSTAAEAVKVSAKAGKKIVSEAFEGEVATLAAHQHLLLEADGTNWWVLAGQPAPAVVGTAGTVGPNILSWGHISAAAAIEASSGDFTVAKTGTGQYEIKWTTAKSAAQYAIVLTTYGLPSNGMVTAIEAAKFSIATQSAEVQTNMPWAFVVVAKS